MYVFSLFSYLFISYNVKLPKHLYGIISEAAKATNKLFHNKTGARQYTRAVLTIFAVQRTEQRTISKYHTIVHTRLQLMWIESVLCHFLFWLVIFFGFVLSLKLQIELSGIP